MHILVCDDDAAFSAKVAEYAAVRAAYLEWKGQFGDE